MTQNDLAATIWCWNNMRIESLDYLIALYLIYKRFIIFQVVEENVLFQKPTRFILTFRQNGVIGVFFRSRVHVVYSSHFKH